jgi:hypothetical protein
MVNHAIILFNNGKYYWEMIDVVLSMVCKEYLVLPLPLLFA